MLYFAYGSNLNADDFALWLSHTPFDPAALSWLRPLQRALLPDRALRFTRFSKTRNGGVLDVVEHPGASAPGIIFDVLNASIWEVLDHKEGVAQGHYQHLDTVAVTLSGERHPVRTYEVHPVHRQAFVPPSDHYLDVVAAGCAAHGVDTAALFSAAANR